MRGALLSTILLAAACYQPAIPAGARCSQSGDCPGGQACVEGVCGGTASGPDAPGAPDAPGLPDAPPALPDAPPGTIVFVAGADPSQLRDTELWADFPSANYGTQDHFSVDEKEVGLLWFDLSSVPSGLTVVKATLRVVTTDDADEGGGTVLVYPVLESWTEADATWTLRTANSPWSSPGAAPPSRGSTPVATLRPNKTRTPFEVALPAALVSAWLAAPASNLGLAFVRGTSGEHVHLGSREGNAASTLTLELRP